MEPCVYAIAGTSGRKSPSLRSMSSKPLFTATEPANAIARVGDLCKRTHNKEHANYKGRVRHGSRARLLSGWRRNASACGKPHSAPRNFVMSTCFGYHLSGCCDACA